MKNLSVGAKLISGFCIVLVLMVISAGMSAYSINNISEQTELYAKYTVPNAEYLSDMRVAMASAKQALLLAIVHDDEKSVNDALEKTVSFAKQHSELLELYAKNQRNKDRDADIEKIRGLIQNVIQTRQKISELLTNQANVNEDMALAIYLNEYEPLLNEIEDIMNNFSETAKERAKAQSETVDQTTKFAWVMLITSAVISIALTVVICNTIKNSILRPVNEIMEVYDEISKGNLGVEIQYESRDEMGRMAKSINKTNALITSYIRDIGEKLEKISQEDMRVRIDMDYIGDFSAIKNAILNTATSLNHIIMTINNAAEQVSVGAAQVSQGAQSLAAGSTEQASTIEELSASVSQIAEDAENNSTNVKTATKYVEQAYENVKDCAEHMKQLTDAMENIGTTSNHITNITKVIEDIAFQTNILALNAAIEAARAGNAGKGFAVVADEVRSLASKSAEAAKQTAELISASVVSVEEGSQILKQTAQTLLAVEEKTTMINEIISNINQASSNQAAAIEQIKVGLNQVSSVIQSNAATAEENSATSEEMSAQAAALRKEVGKFKLDSGYESSIPAHFSQLVNLEETGPETFEFATT